MNTVTEQRFKELLDRVSDRLMALTDTKGREYKRGDDNQLANFERLGAKLGLRREQVLMVHLEKHLDAIAYWVSTPSRRTDASEPITGRIMDSILYHCLLLAMAEEESQSTATVHSPLTGAIQTITRGSTNA